MQSKENNPIDTRSFPEIFNHLTKSQQQDLTIRLYNAKACTVRQTIFKWAHGTIPGNGAVRDTVAKVVSKFIGTKTPSDTLFPRI